MRAPLLLARALFLAAVACGCISVSPADLHPSVRDAKASADDSEASRRRTVLETAVTDLKCAHVEIVTSLDRRYSNGSSLRYVLEGCGKRVSYVEVCETYPHCRYLLVSVIPIPGSAAPATSTTTEPQP